MIPHRIHGIARSLAGAAAITLAAGQCATSQQLDSSTVVRGIDAAVRARFEGIAAYTVTEHYVVYRGKDETHPAAEMTVKTTYRKESGKSYTMVSESGSGIIRKFGLEPLLEGEKRVNAPGNREAFWFTSANYDMKLKSGATERVNGVDCFRVSIVPKQKAPNLIIGTLWVDAKDYAILRIEGTGSKSASIWTGPAQVTRDYARLSGYTEAAHAKAVSESSLFGQTLVTIDYTDYKMELAPGR